MIAIPNFLWSIHIFLNYRTTFRHCRTSSRCYFTPANSTTVKAISFGSSSCKTSHRVRLAQWCLWSGQCALWHSRLQYQRSLHPEHQRQRPSLPGSKHTKHMAGGGMTRSSVECWKSEKLHLRIYKYVQSLLSNMNGASMLCHAKRILMCSCAQICTYVEKELHKHKMIVRA